MSENETVPLNQDEGPKYTEEDLGLAGRTARFFIRSPLSPLLYAAMFLMGLMGLLMTPRQEDPQISVPMIDIFVQYPGASANQVSTLAVQPLERIMSEIPGVKHVYSAAERGQGMVTVQFQVGKKMGPSLVQVNDKLASNMDKIPPGVMPPLVKSKGIDDVPIVTLTLWSKDLDGDGFPDVDDGQLRLLAQDLLQALKEVKDTGNGFIVGGRSEQVTIDVYPERLSGYQISLDQVANTIRTANSEQTAGGVESSGTHFSVTTGSFLKTVDDINRLVVGTHDNVPVYVRDVARVTQGPEDAKHLVAYYTGPAAPEELRADGVPAVTIALAKKAHSNGVSVANAIIDRVRDLENALIPNNVEVSITRNYGETAEEKVNELIFKLFVATGFVFILVYLAFRALRPAIVVMLVIPVVLLMTIFMAWITGYTIDRVSLFALIFSIGILVDDAIVVIENIYRRWLEEGRTDDATAVDAVREVGNPTILATFTVIAALLPMGFVTGMMGPYMEPIPALGSVAMFISLFAAFVFTPYFAISKWMRPTMSYLKVAEKREIRGNEKLERLFRRVLTPLIESRAKRRIFKLAMWATFLFTCSFFYTHWTTVKILPLDNKPEFSVVLNMPEGTALPVTANLAHRMAEKVRELPEVTAIQVYAGTARPFDFNGMVRHYYLRRNPWEGELQVQLLNKTERKRSSHQIAVAARGMLKEMIEGTGARVGVVEMPPGPPVLDPVVAEVHGPSPEVRRQFARDLTQMFEEVKNTRDVDNYLREPYIYWRFDVDTEKAVRRGISVDAINRNLSMALGGGPIGDVKQRAGHEPVRILLQVPLAERSQIDRLGDLPVQSQAGFTIPLRELGRFEKVPEEDVVFHKDLRGVEYVVAEVGGRLAAPVYAQFEVQDLIKDKGYLAPDGVVPEAYWFGPPPDDTRSAFEWSGEWTVTFETFRDMGAAFMVALVLIYILVVWEFGNFRIPALIMAPIPLTLLGIIPAHAIMGAEFTATSMIGWIALAGIIVRNSILLVDFAIHEVQHGVPVAEAVIRSCKTRTRPIVITALALVCGASVIVTDPIFQGMAIALAAGVLVSTILTLIVIPLGCIQAGQSLCEVAAATAPAGVTVPCATEPEEAQPTAPKKPPSPSWGIVVWGKLVGALLMIFYAIRGIFLLLFSMFKRPVARKKPTGKPPLGPAPGTPAPGGGSGPGGNAAGGTAPPVGGAPAPAGGGVQGKPGVTGSAAQDVPAERKEPAAEVRSPAVEPAAGSSAPAENAGAAIGAGMPASGAADTDAPAQGPTTPAEQGEQDKKAVEVATRRARPSARAPTAPRKKVAAKKKPVARKSTKREGTANNKSAARQAGGQKKAARRGIRLKVDGAEGPHGLD